jgi:hypothetical protein
MNYQTGHDHAPTFESAIDAPKNKIWGGGNMYLEMSLYYEQLKPYYDYFKPENIKIIVSEEWTRNNGEALNEICEFLGLEPFSDYKDDTTHNAAKQLRNKGLLDFLRLESIKRPLKRLLPDKAKEKIKDRLFYKEDEKQRIDPATYDRLIEFFREDIARTAELTGLDLGGIWNIKDNNALSPAK